MKRFFGKTLALALILVLLVSLCAPAFAATTVLSPQKLTVDGKDIDCEKYNIDGYNYFKLRDLAELLNGTVSQFDVDYDDATKTMVVTTGAPYTHKNGTELKTGVDNSAKAVVSPQTLKVDGEVVDVAAYNIGDVNFFKLRDLGKALHFYVDYDAASNTAIVKQSEEDEDWDTGDAGLDDPRNADGIGETEVLVVSFGTSFNDSRVKTIGAIEAAMEKAFPGYSVRRGFTANIVINHIAKRDGEKIDDFTEALERAVANGVKNLLVQPTHLMNGFEYTDVKEELAKYADKFETIVLGDPILTADEDYDVVIEAITKDTAKYLDGKTAICFMGHGTENASNHVYADMQTKLTEKGYKDYFIGTVEAEPSLQDVVDAVKAAGYTKAIVEPLMIVAGDHANNDMADPEDPESWVSLFKAAGIEATPVLKGLGEFTEIQDLLVEHLKAKAAEPMDEDWDTGDASLDDPLNTAPTKDKELLVVSFGTSFNDNRVATIGAIEKAMAKAFPEYDVRRGFTAQIIINHVLRRDGEKIDNFEEALDKAVAAGVKELLVVPTHLMDGFEYNDVLDSLKAYEGKFDKVTVSKPILTSDTDYDAVIKAITDATAEQAKEEGAAICFMGHGTEAASNHVYADMQAKLTEKGFKNYFIGTVEAEPTLQEVVDAVKAAGYKKVYLEPLMIVAGDHANNDMADPEDPESWVSLFAAAGIEATPILKGLGSFPEIQNLLIEHAKDALAAAPAEEKTEGPTRKIASKADMNSRKSVEKEGATSVTADMLNDGEYDITVATGNSMFRISNAKLIVKDGKMTASFNTSKSYTWLFMGKTDDIAVADEAAFLKGAVGDDGVPAYTVDVEVLNQALDCSSYSKNKDQWYPNVLYFDADSLPEGALK